MTTTTDFTITLSADKSPKEVFDILKDARAWWSGLYNETFDGPTDKLNEEFTFLAGDGMHYSKQKLVELVTDKKIVWLVTDSKLTFLKKMDEWNGSKIMFDIAEKGGKTQVRFTHEGLTPELESYDGCSSAWTKYLEERLQPLLTSDK